MAPAKNYGRIRFYNSRASGIPISQLGSGSFDHLGFFGSLGPNTAVEVGKYQETTVIVRGVGTNPYTKFGGSGYCTNCKFLTTTTVQISGLPKGPYIKPLTLVNKFDVYNRTHEPYIRNNASGTLLVKYSASGTSAIRTYNAKLYAYKANGTVNDAPPDVTIVAFEINASGKWYDTAHSGVWRTLAGQNQAL